MSAVCSGVPLLECPVCLGAAVKARGYQERAPSFCSLGLEWVKCGGAGAAAGRRWAQCARDPRRTGSAAALTDGPPSLRRRAGTARCTRARAVGGLPARAPSKRRAHAGVIGCCQPSGWRACGGARRAPGIGKARSIAALAQVRGGFARPGGAPTGAREWSRAHARHRPPTPPGQAASPGLRWVAGVEGERQAASVEVGSPGAACLIPNDGGTLGVVGRDAALGGQWGLTRGSGDRVAVRQAPGGAWEDDRRQ